MEAWGAERNLFAQGMAEVVNNHGLAAPALKNQVRFYPSRGARPPSILRWQRKMRGQKDRVGEREVVVKCECLHRTSFLARSPIRARLDRVRDKLDEYLSELEGGMSGLDRRIAELRDEKVQLKTTPTEDIAKLQDKFIAEETAYRQAVAAWDG